MIKFIVCLLLLLPSLAFAETAPGVFPDDTPIFSRSYIFNQPLDRTTPFVGLTPPSLSEAQNMKRPAAGVPVGWIMRNGMTKHNSTTLGANTINSLHEYVNKDFETYCLLAQYNDTDIHLAASEPPTAGAVFGTKVYTATGATGPAFGDHINDDWVVAADGASPFTWSGGVAYPDGFYVDHDVVGGENAYNDGYLLVRNDSTNSSITFLQDVAANNEAYIGFRRPLNSFDLYFGSTKNSVAATMSVSYWEDDGTPAWTAVSNLADGTASGGATMAQNGEVAWDADPSDETPRLLDGTRNQLYWYKITVTEPNADITDSVKVYKCTIADDVSAMENLWSGYLVLTVGCLMDAGSGYVDYAGEVTDGTDATYIEMDSFATGSKLYVAFVDKAFGINVGMVASSPNSSASTVTVKYWDSASDTWTSVGSVVDGTSDGTASLAQSGMISWTGSNFTEDKRVLGGVTVPLYWYELTWSAQLSSDVQIWEVSQAEKPDSVSEYKGVIEYNDRAVWWPGSLSKSALDFSQSGFPHIMNGPDSGSTGPLFGPGEVNAMARISSYAVVSTKSPARLYLLEGKVPSSFDSLLLSSNIGVVAPKSLVVIEDKVPIFNTSRSVHSAIFLASDGMYMTDGMTLIKVSQPVADYFNASAPYIEPTAIADAYAWINYKTQTVHFALPINTTGSGYQTTLNKELVYSYTTNEWFDMYVRASPASCGLSLIGSNDDRMTYVGDYAGFVHRVNTGTSDNGTKITHFIKTAPITPLMELAQGALNYSSTLRSIKIKGGADTTASSICTITMYPDGKTTGVSAGTISLLNSGYSYVAGKKRVSQTGDEFAFKFESDLLDATMCLYGFTLDFMGQRPE
jgi:hypothetical protein